MFNKRWFLAQLLASEQNVKKTPLRPCKCFVITHVYRAPGHRTRMTSVKDRKRYLLRTRQPGRRDPIHVASFHAQCGNTIPR